MKFFADAMLGKLAKWLRILGCDVEYRARIGDDELIDAALSSGRTILTRDTRLVRRRGARENHFFVRGDGYAEQLRQVVDAFGIDPAGGLFTRCVRCNEPLAPAARESLRDAVPPYVFRTQEIFRSCPSCGRIYWGATHREAMRRHLARILAKDP